MGGIIYNKDVGYHYDRYCELSVKHVSVIFSGYTLVTGVDSLSGDHVCLTFVTNFNFVILQTMDYLNWYEDRLVYMRPVWARQKVVLACRGGDEYLKPNLDYYEISDTADLSRGDYTIGDEDFEYFVQYYPYIMDD